jgi:acyl-CoA synthetase (AMP-forming)/AMP-acid ligase II
VFRDELPTTPTGKVLRRNLVDELRGLDVAASAAPGQTTG